MRQQFDPRRLEEAAKQRAESAVQAAAEFSLDAALAETTPTAPDTADEPAARARLAAVAYVREPTARAHTLCTQTLEQARRWAHDVVQAHKLSVHLNAEKVRHDLFLASRRQI